jgi:hypothetical protein|tara:strand:+ start:3191 stop:4021 length:831 start_codon:yes stop_codon:yes gene_type:complete
MRTRYNKKRNTAFVYEVLIREGTSAILQKDDQRKNAIVKIIKKHFSTRSLLYKDLECYQSLQERQSLSEDKCLRVVKEARMQKRMIDPSTLFKQQTNLIKDVNKELEPAVFNNFVPNYKSLANIYQMFSDNVDPKSAVILEELVVDHMSKEPVPLPELEIDNLILETFINKFNNKYNDKLMTEQKRLLNLYISSFVDNSVELKMFLNEELIRLKKGLKSSKSNVYISVDDQMKVKTEQIIEKLEGYRQVEADENMLLTILKVQQLVGEIEENGSSN